MHQLILIAKCITSIVLVSQKSPREILTVSEVYRLIETSRGVGECRV